MLLFLLVVGLAFWFVWECDYDIPAIFFAAFMGLLAYFAFGTAISLAYYPNANDNTYALQSLDENTKVKIEGDTYTFRYNNETVTADENNIYIEPIQDNGKARVRVEQSDFHFNLLAFEWSSKIHTLYIPSDIVDKVN